MELRKEIGKLVGVGVIKIGLLGPKWDCLGMKRLG